MKIFIYFSCFLYITLTLSPKKHETKYESPEDKASRTLMGARYCNDDEMQKGDYCFCGRIMFTCCASNDKCTGTLTRSCSKTVDYYECTKAVEKGLTYWKEMQKIEEKMECSNGNYEKN